MKKFKIKLSEDTKRKLARAGIKTLKIVGGSLLMLLGSEFISQGMRKDKE